MRVKFDRFALGGALAAALLSATPTWESRADANACATRAEVLSHLSGEYGEAPVAIGAADNGGVIEVMRSAESNTFTIIITMPDGMTCMIAAGRNWEDLRALTRDARL